MKHVALSNFQKEVQQELEEMGKLMRVPRKALSVVLDAEEMGEYEKNGMSVSECASLLVELCF